VESAEAGDIIAIAGLHRDHRLPTRSRCRNSRRRCTAQPVDSADGWPWTFSVNNSPLAGREGDKVTSRMIRRASDARIRGQCRLPASPRTGDKDAFRGPRAAANCSWGVLIEQMRREGFELSISPAARPLTATIRRPATARSRFEEVVIDVDEGFAGVVH